MHTDLYRVCEALQLKAVEQGKAGMMEFALKKLR